MKLQILQKLVPGLRKEGYTEESATESSSSAARAAAAPNQPRPQVTPPGNAPPPGQYAPPPTFPHGNPLEIGRRDLDPIPMNPFSPAPLFGGPLSGDGMFVGPDHPIWAGRGQGGHGGFADRNGPWGGDGYLPSIGAPPGARFDPVGPGMGPFPPGGPGSGGFGQGPGGRGRGGLGGPHAGPDNDEFMPPGMVSAIPPASVRNLIYLRVICTCDPTSTGRRNSPTRYILSISIFGVSSSYGLDCVACEIDAKM